jgi:hypothetical protein
MKPSAQTPGSTRRATPSPTRLLHTLYVYCATTLLLALVVYTFLLILLLRTVSPASRRVTFDPSTRNSTHTPARPVAPPPPPPPRLPEKNKPAPPPVPPRAARPPSLSLTITPRELEPPTPVVTEDPLRALSRICAFLVSNTARATQREELGVTPPLAGLEPYLEAVRVDLAYIDDVVAENRAEAEEEGERKEIQRSASDVIVESSEETEDINAVAASASVDPVLAGGTGVVSADAHVLDEPVLVQQPQLAAAASTTTHTPPLPPSESPTQTPAPPLPIITRDLSPPPTTTTNPKPKRKPSADTTTTAITNTANPRRRKDAVLRGASSHAASLADVDADDAAVRAAALLARFADIGAELEGTVRERGAALWAALSRRSAPLDLPVPPLPRTPSSAALIEERGARVVEASRAVAHQAAWHARFAAYRRLFGPVAEQT